MNADYLKRSSIDDEENNDVFELLFDAVEDALLPPLGLPPVFCEFELFAPELFVLLLGTWVDTESRDDCLLAIELLVILLNIEDEADSLADIELGFDDSVGDVSEAAAACAVLVM